MIELTRLTKIGGPLTKRLYLDANGKLISDGAACVMLEGHAQRIRLATPGAARALAALLPALTSADAIALGRLRQDLPDRVQVATADKLKKLNGTRPPDLIARNAEHIAYVAGQPAFALVDVDSKGMTPAVDAKIKAAGGYEQALAEVLPDIATTARIIRKSTSTGITHLETCEVFPGSKGLHVYLTVRDGGDVERFLNDLHERCWLHGYGWYMVGAAGQLLDRSIVDRMVGLGERLVFEGRPQLDAMLDQDAAFRIPTVYDGDVLDTVVVCRPLSLLEKSKLESLKAKAAHELAPKRAAERRRFIVEHTEMLVKAKGLTHQRARRVIERQADGVLLPDVVLPWDSDEFEGCTVADVLADPGKFVGATLSDPIEGPGYGMTKALIMRRPDGTPWIHSFAHGRTVYPLKHDDRAVKAAIEAVPHDQAADTFVRLAVHADLSTDEIEQLRDDVAARAGVTKTAIKNKLKTARAAHAEAEAEETRNRKAAERDDPRPRIHAPREDAPWLDQMQVLNDVLGASAAAIPPARDVDGYPVSVQTRRVPGLHTLTADGANEGDTAETRQAAPEQPLLSRLDETALAEQIERHIDYFVDTKEGPRSVHLAPSFVHHFHHRPNDESLPIMAAIATLPIVTPDGRLLSKPGLERETGVVFMVPNHILDVMPRREECTNDAMIDAIKFLTEEWLCDVATSYTGKCILISAVTTIIQRSLFDQRPVFFVTSGRRGGGKTTVLTMLMMAATGAYPAASPWSPNPEERRKALLAYLLEANPAIIWDNIPRGSQISCPHIEAASTTKFYSDRKLGVSEKISVSAATINLFTGNNISPRGELVSRSLIAHIEVDRTDPENREFRHPDPVGWTERHRSEILRALYTIMLGNPALRRGSNAVPNTRFKSWWRYVGSALEHAAALHTADTAERVRAKVDEPPDVPPVAIDFRSLFLSQEQGDDESSSLADALAAMAGRWPKMTQFKAVDLAKMLNDRSEYAIDADKERSATIREVLFGTIPQNQDLTSKAVSSALRKNVGNPVPFGSKTTLILKSHTDSVTEIMHFYVEAK